MINDDKVKQVAQPNWLIFTNTDKHSTHDGGLVKLSTVNKQTTVTSSPEGALLCAKSHHIQFHRREPQDCLLTKI